MGLDYGFVGEVDRSNSMTAVADTMNQKNNEILAITLEMGGKKSIEMDGNFYAMDKVNDNDVKDIRGMTTIADKEALCTMLGIPVESIGTLGTNKGYDAVGVVVTPLTSPANGARISLTYVDASTNNVMTIGVELDENGLVTAFSPLKDNGEVDAGTTDPDAIHIGGNSVALEYSDVVDNGGLLASWGIKDSEELLPGDLFLIQQKLQIIKDLISTVHTTGKTQGDVMREATQKFSQG